LVSTNILNFLVYQIFWPIFFSMSKPNVFNGSGADLTFASKFSTMLLASHNLIRWAILFFGVWTVIQAFTGLRSKRALSPNDNRASLLFMIFCDIQLLIGLVLYYNNGHFENLTTGMGNVMKNASMRFFSVEHAFTMILAWVLVHVGRTAVKKADPEQKHKRMLLFFGLALLLILISIPWPFRPGIGKPLFPMF
jgi:hypothetical protein